MAAGAAVELANLRKTYGGVVALDTLSLDIKQGEFVTLLGPSGSGKTTSLMIVAGFEEATAGEVRVGGQAVTHRPPHRRNIGVVFQSYALFPHMTVAANVAYPLCMRSVGRDERRRRATAALELVQLGGYGERYPAQLSGGQQQRVALARALVFEPPLLLMDEPLGALDKKLRDQMQLEIKRIHRELGTTIVYVTHDQEEAMTMSDRICLMNQGRIEQLGTPSDLYFRPRTLFAADFLGESNLLEGTVQRIDGSEAEITLARDGSRAHAAVHAPLAAGSKVRVMVRPQNIAVRAEPAGVNALSGKVLDSMITGSLTKLYVSSPAAGAEPLVLCYPTSSGRAPYAIGDDITLHWNCADAVIVPEIA